MNEKTDHTSVNGPARGIRRAVPHFTRPAWLTLAIVSACCIVLAGPVAVTSSAPRDPAATTPSPRGPMGNRDGRGGPDAMNRDGRDGREPRDLPRAPTTQERDEAVEFFRQHMKFRMRIFDQLPDGRPVKARMMQMMMERYRRLQRARMEDSTMFDLMLQQMELQDDALSLLQQQRRTAGDEYDRIQGELRGKVRQIIDLSLQERQKRIERLEKQLADQKARLEQDMANPDALADQHVQQMRNDADEVGRIRQSLGIRGGGFGGGPPRQPATDRASTEPSEKSGH